MIENIVLIYDGRVKIFNKMEGYYEEEMNGHVLGMKEVEAK